MSLETQPTTSTEPNKTNFISLGLTIVQSRLVLALTLLTVIGLAYWHHKDDRPTPCAVYGSCGEPSRHDIENDKLRTPIPWEEDDKLHSRVE